jgi:uncharacterized protein
MSLPCSPLGVRVLHRFVGLVVFGLTALIACSDETNSERPPGIQITDAGLDGTPLDGGGGVPRRAGVIRVATFNVRRFFDTVCESGNCDAMGDFEAVVSQSVFDAQVDKLAKGIALIDPDVIALEEVETTRCLDALVAKLATEGRTFPIAHLGEIGAAGSVDVAVLARGALGEIKTHRDTKIPLSNGSTTVFSRELLEVRMTFGARQVVMFGAHFRSKVNDDPDRRLAEAKAAKLIIAAVGTELPDALVVLGGDLNDTPGSEPINALEAGGALVRVAKDVSLDQQATYVFNGQKEAIDHIFAGVAQVSRYVPMSATSYKDGPNGGFSGSDHAALSADFKIE